MVSKKTGMTVVKNQNNKLNATRTPSESRICIDYKKLKCCNPQGPLSFTF